MRLFEAILEANQQAGGLGGAARLIVGDLAESLPVIALTCIDPRLTRHLPGVLGIPESKFIWLRNAGNIITGPTSSTMRSLALACAVKGGREIAVIGHTDCGVRKTSTMALIDAFNREGVQRASLPDDLVGYFGLFASERQNVMKSVDHARQSPLIGPGIPVHGLLIDIESGRLEWVVNGYDTAARSQSATVPDLSPPEEILEPPTVSGPPVKRPPAVEEWISKARPTTEFEPADFPAPNPKASGKQAPNVRGRPPRGPYR